MSKLAITFVVAAILLAANGVAAQERGDPRREGFGRPPGMGPRGGGFDMGRRRGGPPDMGGFRGGGPPGMGGFRGGGPPGMGGFRGGGPPGMGREGGGPPWMRFRGGGPPDRGGPGGDRGSRLEGFLRSMDANRNGVLEPGEVPEERRRMLRFMAERLGLDPSKPIPLDQIGQTIRRRFMGEEGGPDEQGPDKSADEAEPLVPGFGLEQDLPRVPEFGERVDYAALMPEGSSSGGRRSESSRRMDPERESRVRRFAEAMFSRYDRNRNGVLEREEWGESRVTAGADRNGDGRVTKDELAARLADYSRRRSGDESDRRSSSESSRSRGSGSNDSNDSHRRRSYRFLTSTERLPEGLPDRDRFARLDANADGQVAMAEYSSYWSDLKAREFARYDLNHDGLITPGEWMQAQTVGGGLAGPVGRGPPGGSGSPGGSKDAGSSEQSGSSGAWWLQ